MAAKKKTAKKKATRKKAAKKKATQKPKQTGKALPQHVIRIKGTKPKPKSLDRSRNLCAGDWVDFVNLNGVSVTVKFQSSPFVKGGKRSGFTIPGNGIRSKKVAAGMANFAPAFSYSVGIAGPKRRHPSGPPNPPDIIVAG